MAESAILVQAVSTLPMVGLVWLVQVVHYPLFDHVGRDEFASYERAEEKRWKYSDCS